MRGGGLGCHCCEAQLCWLCHSQRREDAFPVHRAKGRGSQRPAAAHTNEHTRVKRVCARCNQPGHNRSECKESWCARCLNFGHEEQACDAGCRRCEGRHPTADCLRPRSYAAALGDFPALPPASEGVPTRAREEPVRPLRPSTHRRKTKQPTPEQLPGINERGAGEPSFPARFRYPLHMYEAMLLNHFSLDSKVLQAQGSFRYS